MWCLANPCLGLWVGRAVPPEAVRDAAAVLRKAVQAYEQATSSSQVEEAAEAVCKAAVLNALGVLEDKSAEFRKLRSQARTAVENLRGQGGPPLADWTVTHLCKKTSGCYTRVHHPHWPPFSSAEKRKYWLNGMGGRMLLLMMLLMLLMLLLLLLLPTLWETCS